MPRHTPALVRRDTFTEFWTPRTPRAGNTARSNRCMSREDALTHRMIQINSEAIRNMMVVDIDQADGMAMCDVFCEAGRKFPVFNWAIESKSGGVHLVYVLAEGVTWTARSREAPRRYFEDVRKALTAAAGGDPAYGNYMTYNPLYPGAEVRWLREEPWTLQELQVAIGPRVGGMMEAARLLREREETVTEGAGESRHQRLFDDLRRYAYTEWSKHYDDADGYGMGRLSHEEAVILEGRRLNDLNNPALPLPDSEVVSLAKSVARWTWKRFRKDSKSETQKAASMRTEAFKTRAERIGELRIFHERGELVNVQFIRDRYGVSKPTALSYLSQLGITKAKQLEVLDPQVRDLFEQGDTLRDIAELTGATLDQVRYSIKRQGLFR